MILRYATQRAAWKPDDFLGIEANLISDFRKYAFAGEKELELESDGNVHLPEMRLSKRVIDICSAVETVIRKMGVKEFKIGRDNSQEYVMRVMGTSIKSL